MDYPEFIKEYPVHVYETGPDGKLSLASLFDYFQDIASEHAVSLGYGREELMKNNHFWVLSRMFSRITELPEWGSKITIRTWPRGTDKLFALRDFEARFSDGRIAAKATSSWLILDYSTKRVKRPDEDLSRLHFRPESIGALERNADKLAPPADTPVPGQPFRVRISDLDVNLHTNNVRYIKWVTDSYDLDFTMNNVPVSLEINYLAESRFNDNIVILTSDGIGGEKIYDHLIVRPDDNKELCRLRIMWKTNHS
ncbi:MAG TPA: thioesterase [Bacteroidales bacterium]|nr:thioesterase [Bacteroidales bacterium]